MSSAEEVAAWAAGLDVLPHDVDEWIRLAFLDFLGLFAAGEAAIARGVGGLRLHHPVERADRGTSELELAGLAYHYARAANVLDGDDGNNLAGAAHVGSTVFGSLLAAATPSTSYASFRVAAAIGYEVGIRSGATYGAGPYVSSGAAATIAGAAGLATLRGLPLIPALSVATARAPLSALSDEGMRESIGWAAFTAFLVGGGSGPSSLFGYSPLDDTAPGFTLQGSYRKPYLACRATHSALDAVRELRDRHAIDPAAITSIVVETTTFGSLLTNAAPITIDAAVFSYPTVIALALLYDGPRPADWLEERYRAPQVRSLAALVTLVQSDWADSQSPASYPARVTIFAGSTYTAEVLVPRGDASLPLEAHDVVAKAAEGTAYGTASPHVLTAEGTLGELLPHLLKGK